MLITPRSTLSLTFALCVFAMPAVAGDAKAVAYGAAGSPKSQAECKCGACCMYKADVATLCKNVALGIAPASFCEGTCDADAAAMKKNPSAFYAQVFMTRRSDVNQALDAVKARFLSADATECDRTRLLDFASHFPNKSNEKLTADLWKCAPTSFTSDHLLAFAWNAPDVIKAELKSRATQEVKVAAWFAFEGDACGKDVLIQNIHAFGASKASLRDAAVAAMGLEALGADHTLGRVLATARTRALAALDGGNLCEARTLAIEGNYFSQAASKGHSLPVAWMSAELDELVKAKSEKLANADDVFAMIETLQS